MFVPFFSYLAATIDLPILDWIAANLHSPLLDALMPLVTILGNGGIIWVAWALLMLLYPKTIKTGLAMAIALLMGLLLCNLTLKPLIARMRPFDYQQEILGNTIHLLISAPHDHSFPSGHTIASFEAAAVLLKNSRKMGIPALILAVLISFSRLYLYVHYPTDVLASIVLGTALGLLGNKLAQKVKL